MDEVCSWSATLSQGESQTIPFVQQLRTTNADCNLVGAFIPSQFGTGPQNH
jgi:hypothetical protein